MAGSSSFGGSIVNNVSINGLVSDAYRSASQTQTTGQNGAGAAGADAANSQAQNASVQQNASAGNTVDIDLQSPQGPIRISAASASVGVGQPAAMPAFMLDFSLPKFEMPRISIGAMPTLPTIYTPSMIGLPGVLTFPRAQAPAQPATPVPPEQPAEPVSGMSVVVPRLQGLPVLSPLKIAPLLPLPAFPWLPGLVIADQAAPAVSAEPEPVPAPEAPTAPPAPEPVPVPEAPPAATPVPEPSVPDPTPEPVTTPQPIETPPAAPQPVAPEPPEIDDGPGYRDITSAEAQALLQSNPKVFLLDVRTPAEYQDKHIPGSTLIPVSELPDRLSEVPTDAEAILVYCKSGGRSARAAGILAAEGFENLLNLKGGITGWGGATETVCRTCG